MDPLTDEQGTEDGSNPSTHASDEPELSAAALAEENAELREEVDHLKTEGSVETKARRRRIRKLLVVVLVVLTSLSTLASTVGVWVHRTVFDTDRFVTLMEPLASDPQVTSELGTYLTNQIFVAVDVQGKVEGALEAIAGALPPGIPVVGQIPVLAGPITAAAQNAVRQRVTEFLDSPAFQQLWSDLLRAAHPKVVALLRGDYSATPNVQLSGDTVYLNAVPVVAGVLRTLVEKGLGVVGLNVTIPQISASDVPQAAIDKLKSALGVDLPANFGQIPIMSAEKLHSAQQAVKTFDRLMWALVALTIVLIALSLGLSLNRRRTLVQLAIGVAVALLVAAATIRFIRNKVVETITDPGARGAARDAIVTVLHSLRTTGLVVFYSAIIIGVIAYLAGRPRWLVALTTRVRAATAQGPEGSRLERLVERRFDWFAIGGAAVATILLFVVGFGIISVIVLGALYGLWFWGIAALRERARAHAPEDAAPVT